MMINPKKMFEPFILLIISLSVSLDTVLSTTKSLVVEETAAASRSTIRCLEKEKEALLSFKREVIDDSGMLSSWGGADEDCCKWTGVRCDNVTHRVVRLDLNGDDYSDGGLRGNISPSLIELRDLNYLDLSNNDFSPTPFPEFIGSLTKLRYLDLSRNHFKGPIPHHLGNLTELQYLNLTLSTDVSSLTTNLDWISPNLHSLEYLDLSYYNLSLVTNWFQAISSTLPSIKELHLRGCDLPPILPSSSLPSSIVNVSTSLSVLDLSWNKNIFSSSRNGGLSLLKNYWLLNSSSSLTSIDLSNTNLEGNYILDAFQNIVSLSHLYLSNNSLKNIPKFFGNMSNLKELYIRDNSLDGQLYEIMMNLSGGPLEENLQVLDMRQNSISGMIPNMSRFSFLTTLHLGANQLNWTISEGFLQLPNLQRLGLSSNQFTGQVPADLSISMRSLRILDLYNNSFNGTLMTGSIAGLSKLEILSLGSNQLEGAFTEAHVANLSRLQRLDLSSNKMLTLKWNSHFIPPFQLHFMNLASCNLGPQSPQWLKTQKQLRNLDISNTQLSDTISNLFHSLSAPTLNYLNASNNKIHGFFPNISFSFFSSGTGYPDDPSSTLDLSRNKILGSMQILCNSTKLQSIDLSYNQLSGHLSNCFANFKALQHLNLGNNHFHGKIPPSFGSLYYLLTLNLRNNNFSGEIPTSMRNCRNLEVMDLAENRLSGEVPSWIGGENSSSLEALFLRSNAFYGSMPPNLCNLENIQVLDLSSNTISGEIPKCLYNLTAMTREEKRIQLGYTSWDPTRRYFFFKINSVGMFWKRVMVYVKSTGWPTFIDLSGNNLTGEIPSQITQLRGLLGLNFSSNKLTGPIPQNIGQLTLLNVLDLSKNRLSGAIPTSLSELSHLGILDLSYNNLFGRIPFDGHQSTFDGPEPYIGNSDLCGRPLNKSCPEDHPIKKPEHEEEEEEEEDEFITEGFYKCMGLGFFVGFWGIVGTILLNKSFRYSFLKVVNNIEDFIYVRVELSKISFWRRSQSGQQVLT